MNRTARWRYGLILLLVLLGVVYALPNIYGEDYAVQLSRKKSVTGVTLDVTKKQLESDIKTALKAPSQKPEKILEFRLAATSKLPNQSTYKLRTFTPSQSCPADFSKRYSNPDLAQPDTFVCLSNKLLLSDSDISDASAGKGANNSPKVTIDVSGSSAPILLRMTQNNIGKPLAVVYFNSNNKAATKGSLTSIANINSALSGQFQITLGSNSNFSQAQALAQRLKDGAKLRAALKAGAISYKKIIIPTEKEDAKQGEAIVDGDPIIVLKNSKDQIRAQAALSQTLSNQYAVSMTSISKMPSFLSSLGAKPMSLGLDLRGGIHFLLEIDQKKIQQDQNQADRQQIQNMLHATNGQEKSADGKRQRYIKYKAMPSPQQLGNKKDGSNFDTIEIQFDNTKNLDDAYTRLQQPSLTNSYSITKNISKLSLLLIQNREQLDRKVDSMINQNIETLTNKINRMGVAEPAIQRQGKDAISVDLPGATDMAQAKKSIGTMATVEFRLAKSKPNVGTTGFSRELFSANEPCPYAYPKRYKDPNGSGEFVCLSNMPILTGNDIKDATAGRDQQNNSPIVSISASGSNLPLFERATANNIGQPLATVYSERKAQAGTSGEEQMNSGLALADGSVISIANIKSALSGQFQITFGSNSNFSQALTLAQQLRSGAYATPPRIVQEQRLGPSLGQANIDRGVWSCLIGSLMVIVFMALYYRVFGLIANLALVLNVVFVVAIMSLLGATMTLPGIAGIILTVGMAVDANVLINERIREEIRNGLSIQPAIKAGYERAFSTIVDANVTTLLVACILYGLGTGSVKGFAVTLTIGLLTSMFTSIFFTRAIVNLIFGRNKSGFISIGMSKKWFKTKGAK